MHIANRQTPTQQQRSQLIKQQTKEFLANGGTIDFDPVMPIEQRIQNVINRQGLTSNVKERELQKLYKLRDGGTN